jgi:hypothetical protein
MQGHKDHEGYTKGTMMCPVIVHFVNHFVHFVTLPLRLRYLA